jgi:DUF4097 and DUF4098 domain-containing protein YvlB/polyhydroxyalkanoate synthesis regulator phasin
VREEIKRISKLVAEGKLSPEDAADLIDAFYASEKTAETATEEKRDVPPPPPTGAVKDPFKSIVDSIEKMTKEGLDAVNWPEVSKQARDSAKKGLEALKGGIDEISKGKVNLGWLTTQESREVTLPLAVPTGKTLKVENASGNVKIVGGFDVGTVTANAHFKGATLDDARAKAEAYTLIIEESDHMVLIRQPDVSGLSVDLEIQLAGSAPIELRVESGDLSVLDTRAGCRIHSRSGNLHLRGLNGPIEITADSGDISVEDSTTPSLAIENKSGDVVLRGVVGNINARTASGDVRTSASHGKVVAVESVSGDVVVDLDQPLAGNVSVRTVSGNSRIGLCDGSDARVSLSTLRGSVACSLPLEDEARAEQRITGRLGAGTGSLDVSAVTGDINLEMRDQTCG